MVYFKHKTRKREQKKYQTKKMKKYISDKMKKKNELKNNKPQTK